MRFGRQILLFICSFAITFALGDVYFDSNKPKQTAKPTKTAGSDNAPTSQAAGNPEATTATAGEGRIFIQRGCVQCHCVKALNVQGGAVGPDLSNAYNEVQAKHGIPIQQFLKKPNSAVMSGVLGSRPLTAQEYNAVLAALKAAASKKQS